MSSNYEKFRHFTLQREIAKRAAKYQVQLPSADLDDRVAYHTLALRSHRTLEPFEVFEYSVLVGNLQEVAKAWGFEKEFKQMMKDDVFHTAGVPFLYDSVSKVVAIKLKGSKTLLQKKE
jgi:hypothetical protein